MCDLQFRRLVTAIQNIALTLNRHYPARLYRLYLVDAPAIVHIPVRVSRHQSCPYKLEVAVFCSSWDAEWLSIPAGLSSKDSFA
jgi:hypothetical protein